MDTSLAQSKLDADTRIDSLETEIKNADRNGKLSAIKMFSKYYCYTKPKETIAYIKDGLELLSIEDDLELRLYFNRMDAISQRTIGNYESSLENNNQALQLSFKIGDSVSVGKVFFAIGSDHRTLGNFDEARNYYNKGLDIARQIEDTSRILLLQDAIATTWQRQGDYKKSLEIYNELFTFCKSKNLECTDYLVNKGIALNHLERPGEALSLFFKVRKKYETSKNPYPVAAIDHHIGYVLERAGLYEEALRYFNDVYDTYNTIGDIHRLSAVHLNLASTNKALDSLKISEYHYSKALELKEQAGIKTTGQILLGLGELYLELSDFQKAILYFEKAQEVYQELNDRQGLLFYHLEVAEFHLKNKSLQKALDNANIALKISKTLDLPKEIGESYSIQSSIYNEMGELKKGLEAKELSEAYLEKYKDPNEIFRISKMIISDTLKNNETTNAITDFTLAKSNSKTGSRALYWFVVVVLSGFIIFIIIAKYKGKRNLDRGQNKPKEYLLEKEVLTLDRNLKHLMKQDELYLNKDLSLNDLSRKLNTNEKKLSILLNNHLQTNFYDFINTFRIQHFINEIKSDKGKMYTTVGLAEKSGFKSKSSFYRSFRKEIGMSPKEFKESITKEQ